MLKKYTTDKSGNFSIMMGVTASVLLMAVGAAVDVSGMLHQKSMMQDYADAAVLAAARTLDDDIAVLTEAAQDSVAANSVIENTITTGIQVNNNFIRAELSAQYSTSLMGIFGFDNLDINVAAEAPNATPDPLNLSLVLDVTGSMAANGNMSALKTAANRLVNTLERHDDGNIQISVTPFANYVNVGTSNRNKPWMSVPNDWIEYHDEICTTTVPIISQSGCVTTTTTSSYGPYTTGGTTTYNDGVPTTTPTQNHPGGTTTNSSTTCEYTEYGPPEQSCYTPPPTHHKWHGIVGSRQAPLHEQADYGNSKFQGLMDYTFAVAEILPLTNSFNSVRSKINSLQPNGETYIPTGLAWGWRMVSQAQPFTEAASNQGTGAKNAVLLMTDGKNTRYLGTGSVLAAPGNSSYPVIDHSTSDNTSVSANALTADICEGIKDDDIIVYTVGYRFPVGSVNATRNMLRNCATEPENAFYAVSPAELSAAFDAIAASLISVRLSG